MKLAPAAFLAPVGALLLSGCLARAAVDIVTLPVKVASAGVDAVTTSQSEADQKRGRQIRQREERLGRLERDHGRLAAKCERGDDGACAKADKLQSKIDELVPRVPYERRD
ncbi:MAG: hypothetical protein ABW194_06085 [Novosphingobium sp.]